MKIAIEGCAHGELEKIYDTLGHLELQNKCKIDLLLCCGDFQASRNNGDLQCMAVPPKFRDLCTFYKYYSGEKTAPILTIVIGGNHEASNYFQELPYGGWLAPNIYFLGYAGVVKVGGLKIGGISGIFKARDYHKGRFETVPYSEDTKRSCYHTRVLDVFRLKQVSKPIDIFLSHDWPEGVYKHGNIDDLLRKKPFFKEEVENNKLGSPVCAELLDTLQPSHWFAAHLHVKFPALIRHENGTETKFLALDKCLPRRQFLQVIDVPHTGDVRLEYDVEWCAILRNTDHLTSVRAGKTYMPGPGHSQRWNFKPTEEEIENIRTKLDNDFYIPLNFVQTAPPHDPNRPKQPPWSGLNPQTTEFCHTIGIDDPLALLQQHTPQRHDLNDSGSRHNYSSFQVSGDSELFESPMRTPTRANLSRTPLTLPPAQNSTPDLPANFSPRTPLNLPAPKNLSSNLDPEEPVISDVIETPTVSSTPKREAPCEGPEEVKGETSCVEYSLDVEPTSNTPDVMSAPGPKKFRRRNVALYNLTSEDD